MSDSSSSSPFGGIGLCGMVFIVFLALKLAEIGAVATWSWWWITSPLWIPPVLVISILLLCLVVGLVAVLCGVKLAKKKLKLNFKR